MTSNSIQFEHLSTIINPRPSKGLVFRQSLSMPDSQSPPRAHVQVDRDKFLERLIFIRERLEMSKSEFAASIGITKSNYTQVEKGKRMLTVDQVYNLFIVHGVPMEYILAGRTTDLPKRFH